MPMYSPTIISGGSIGSYPVVSANKLSRTRKALAAVRAGQASGKIFCIGDSATLGYQTQATANGYTNARPTSWPVQLGRQMTTRGVKATANSFNPVSGYTTGAVTYPQFDTRYGGPWTFGGISTLGGTLLAPTAINDTLSLTLTDTIDTIDIWYATSTGNGNIAVNVDGGATLATINTNGGQAVAKTTVSCTRGAHTINLVASATNVFLWGLRAYDSTAPEMTIFNLGWGGGMVANFVGTGSAWSPETILPTINPDLTIICLTINDINNGTALSTYQTNLQKIVTAAKAGGGDVILLNGPPSGGATYTNNAAGYLGVIDSIASTNNCIVMKTDLRFGDYTTANAAGLMQDTVHPNIYGANDIAAFVAWLLADI